MKMFKKIGIAAIATGMVLAGCSNSAGGGGAGGPRYSVGDIVFKDGSSIPYSAELTLTEEQKNAAIAVIFYVGTGLNSDVDGVADTSKTRTLGVGLYIQGSLAWCPNSANASDKDITTIQCPASGSEGAYTFTGDKNGSGNLEQIASFLTANGSTDDTATAANYPAFYFARNYKATADNVEGTSYESGWYLPSIAELFEIYRVKAAVDAARQLCGRSQFGTNRYWSSSQYASDAKRAYNLDFSDGSYGFHLKNNTGICACAVREF